MTADTCTHGCCPAAVCAWLDGRCHEQRELTSADVEQWRRGEQS